MSPCASDKSDRSACFPRMSGDEPEAQQAVTLALMFSPRERG